MKSNTKDNKIVAVLRAFSLWNVELMTGAFYPVWETIKFQHKNNPFLDFLFVNVSVRQNEEKC